MPRDSTRRRMLAAAMVVLGIAAGARRGEAAFLDVAALSTGMNGSFAGSLDGLPVAGAITVNDGSFSITGTGTGFGDSTINGTSPQYSYSNIYNPSIPLTDRIGYSKLASAGFATIVISFGAAVTDLVFEVANLDGAQFTFDLSTGLTGLSLLSGNGGSGDGLGVLNNTVLDLNPTTAIGVDPATPPPTTGPRSGYGSVQLTGTYQILIINVSTPGGTAGIGDAGSFTLSTSVIPEPSSLALCGVAALAGLGSRRLRRAASATAN